MDFSRSRGARPSGALFFGESGHDLDEVAGSMADIELPSEDTVPAILHRAGRTGQGEKIGAACNAGTGPRLHRRCADLSVGELMEKDRETINLLFEHAAEGLDG